MRRFVWVFGMMVFAAAASGCASECEKKCEKKCDKQYSQAKELAGANWGALEKVAKMGLAACKAACDDG